METFIAIIAIIGVVCLGAFVIALIADLILSSMDGHEGIFFRRKRKAEKEETSVEPVAELGKTVTPYHEFSAQTQPVQEPVQVNVNVNTDNGVTNVDFEKAAEEQKMLNSKRSVIKEEHSLTNEHSPFMDIEQPKDNKAELKVAIKEVTAKAMEQVNEELMNANQDKIREQQEMRARLLAEQEALSKQPVQPEVIVEEEIEEVTSNDYDEELEDLRRLKEDIISLKEDTLKELETAKYDLEEKEREKEREEFDRQIRDKLIELEALKLSQAQYDAEKEELLKYKIAAEQQSAELERIAREKHDLQEQLAMMNDTTGVVEELRLSKEKLNAEREELLGFKKVAEEKYSDYARMEQEKFELQEQLRLMEEKANAMAALTSEKDELVAFQQAIEEKEAEFTRIAQEKQELLDRLNDYENHDSVISQLHAEKQELIGAVEEMDNEFSKIEQENEELQERLRQMEALTQGNTKPFYSEQYYLEMLERLLEELKEVEKDLKLNKREFIPLLRIKRSYDRDQQKLRRKEAIVAKQKIAIYGVSTYNNIDPVKKEKLEEEVKVLNELKDSVFHCDQVLKANKDRYPELEKSNKLLVRTVERLQSEIDSVRAAIAWYQESKQN